jgi:excisionase family DNA binding protein
MLYTTKQVGEQLQLKTSTITRLIRLGKLRAKKIGKSYRVTAEDLASFAGIDDVTENK